MVEPREIAGMSAAMLRRMIGNKQLSPVELVDACIAWIEALDPFENAMVATNFDAARDAARAAEKTVMRGEPLGLLHGLPTGVKDFEATAGLLTTQASPLYRDAVPQEDNLPVARLRAAGAIVVGKTNVPELGAGANRRNPVRGATGNPFNPQSECGRLVGRLRPRRSRATCLPVCTGSDAGVSLRIPAALCGVVGFRPSCPTACVSLSK
ncbi:Acylamidase [Paraburkholderia nemoris]|uniref:amidase family protein n=1 Tax=Paraburkholderia nemoris TaxID=2793076 RepID=UPI001B2042BD|nr:amidase family protein [Paraburkholderia nemoris]CAE6816059.1 Acylamidase [Paraburkholderia nemoris]